MAVAGGQVFRLVGKLGMWLNLTLLLVLLAAFKFLSVVISLTYRLFPAPSLLGERRVRCA